MPSRSPKICALYIYPIKALAPYRVRKMMFSADGPDHDREYMVVDEHGAVITQRSHPQLAALQVRLDGYDVVVYRPGYGKLVLHDYAEPSARREVSIHKEQCVGYEHSSFADQFFSDYLGTRCTLVRHFSSAPRERVGHLSGATMRTRFTDGYPITLLSLASHHGLNARLVAQGRRHVTVLRFRPNILVDGCAAHDEDSWGHATVGDVRLRFEKHCSRCTVPDVDPKTGGYDRKNRYITEVLRTYRMIHAPRDLDVYFSSNFSVELAGPHGSVAIGDTVAVARRTQD